MSAPKSQLATGMADIWQRYRPLIEKRVAQIADAVHLLARNELPSNKRYEAGGNAHKLAGNLGTFGHAAGSEYARTIELKLLADSPIVPTEVEELSRLAAQLEIVVQEISARMDHAASLDHA